MVNTIYSYIHNCMMFLPQPWNVALIGMLGFVFADGLIGIIDRAWRVIGR